ncbi:2,5-diamino-6-ribosylamino-4(3H)-pyrimidinone 5'-phosphate reductase [uncultured archaeon]|nr:2,5-diamino-6-ribosylamino-4(3H)-pyrimidinone 5'-phosphate reductase [uncultured archaeon]
MKISGKKIRDEEGDGKKFMLEALRLAERGVGKVSPNPLVGAVLVKGGRVVGRGWHEFYGEKHAEVNAIEDAGKDVHGAELYVTLEPCNHYGKQPPCTKAITEAGIRVVHCAIRDPNPVSKSGANALRRKGIKVDFGLCGKEATKQNEAFLTALRLKRPFIALKTAMTQDGFITYGDGKAKKISGGNSLDFGQQLRKRLDAILVGANTVAKDNPRLTFRENRRFNPIRIILDSEANISPKAKVFSQLGETIIVCTKKAREGKMLELAKAGACVVVAKEKDGMVDIKWLVKWLYLHGIRSVLVEAGSKIAASFLSQGLFDRVYILVSPKEIGKGQKGLMAFNLERTLRLRLENSEALGKDLLLDIVPVAKGRRH